MAQLIWQKTNCSSKRSGADCKISEISTTSLFSKKA